MHVYTSTLIYTKQPFVPQTDHAISSYLIHDNGAEVIKCLGQCFLECVIDVAVRWDDHLSLSSQNHQRQGEEHFPKKNPNCWGSITSPPPCRLLKGLREHPISLLTVNLSENPHLESRNKRLLCLPPVAAVSFQTIQTTESFRNLKRLPRPTRGRVTTRSPNL
ncbi:hypothetical protein CDAR_46151 [Caerostris darwini]|uniref:Uncharacterized protein n=1 Tax=Caerostris darwini TaxID=1538125 RepID=A0AAV4R4E0_9ARAC|nr:hypothetical protein CDAR_46151 [Caerostris darwini]